MRRQLVMLPLLLALAVPGAGRAAVAEQGGSEVSSCLREAESTLAVLDCTPASERALEAVASLDEDFSSAWRPPAEQSYPAWCRLPAKIVVYTSSDWVRAAQKLATGASLCAEIYLSIPPLAADKTRFRVLQDDAVRAVSPQIHPVAEIHVTGWQAWVAANKKTWYEAGVEARKRMAEAGYVVENGEVWAVNEFSSAVRRDDGNARANMRAFLRGLHDGEEGMPATRGIVFVIGLDQRLADTSVYKATLQGFLRDAAFWTDLSGTVDFFAQEVYADSRSWGVPGSSRNERARYLNDYLQHLIELAEAGADDIAPARSFLRETYLPLASAAWPWKTAFGDTDMPAEEMQHFVSTQTFAIRHYAGSHPQSAPANRIGFAYAPNPAAAGPGLAAGTGAILDRLAGALREAYDRGGGSQVGACGPPGEHVWCDGDREGAVFNAAWRLLQSWQ